MGTSVRFKSEGLVREEAFSLMFLEGQRLSGFWGEEICAVVDWVAILLDWIGLDLD